MEHYKGVAEKTSVDMGIDLCSHYRLVSKHFLHCSQVGSGFDHVRCKRVPEGMRADLLQNTRPPRKIPCYGEYHRSCKPSSPAIEKHNVLIVYNRQPVPVDPVKVYLLQGLATDRNQSLLIAFPRDAYEPFPVMDVGEPQVHQFGDAQTTSVKCLNDGFVPVAVGLAEVDRINNPVNLFNSKDFRKLQPQPGRLKKGGRVIFELAIDQQKPVKGPYSRYQPCLCPGAHFS